MKQLFSLFITLMFLATSCGGGGGGIGGGGSGSSGSGGGIGGGGGSSNNCVYCGAGVSDGDNSYINAEEKVIVDAILDELPEPTTPMDKIEYREENGEMYGGGAGSTAKIIERYFEMSSFDDPVVDAYEASLTADGFVNYPPWEKVVDGMKYIVNENSTGSQYFVMIIVIEDVPKPTATPRAILITLTPNLANRVEYEEIRNAEPPSILQGRRVTVTETDSAAGPATTYTINYNPTGSNATCTSVVPDALGALEATVPLTPGITTWTTRITKLRYSTVNINYDAIHPAYMMCNGYKVPVQFIGK